MPARERLEDLLRDERLTATRELVVRETPGYGYRAYVVEVDEAGRRRIVHESRPARSISTALRRLAESPATR